MPDQPMVALAAGGILLTTLLFGIWVVLQLSARAKWLDNLPSADRLDVEDALGGIRKSQRPGNDGAPWTVGGGWPDGDSTPCD